MRRRMFLLVLVVLVALPAQTTLAMFVRLPGSWVSDIRLCADGFMVGVGGILKGGVTTVVTIIDASLPSELGTVFAASGPNVVYGTRVFRWEQLQEVGAPVQLTLDRFENGASLTGGAGRANGDVIANCVLFEENAPLFENPFVITNHVESPNCGVYVVQSGDTLGRIARRHLLSTRTLAAANGISNVNLVISGTTLNIPCANT